MDIDVFLKGVYYDLRYLKPIILSDGYFLRYDFIGTASSVFGTSNKKRQELMCERINQAALEMGIPIVLTIVEHKEPIEIHSRHSKLKKWYRIRRYVLAELFTID